MRYLTLVATLIAPVLGATAPATAQSIPVDSGQPVRVALRAGPYIDGMMVRQTPERLVVRSVEGDRQVLIGDVESVASPIRYHSARSAFKGLGFGVLGGAIVGGAVAAIAMNGCTGDMCGMDILAGPAVAVIGGIVGLIVGSVRTTTDWRPIWPPKTATP